MNVELKEITRDNYQECITLTLTNEQKTFVASNLYSLVQAAYEPELYPLGVYNDGVMVGFILYDYDEELKGWSMSRYMIDKNHQKLGIGTRALSEFIKFFKDKYNNEPLYTSAEVNNEVAIALYEGAGFIKKDTFEYEAAGMKFKEIRMVLV